MTLPGRQTPPAPALSRRHRAWIALYVLDSTHCDRREVLRQNDVTEADLQEFFDSWFQLRGRVAEAAA
ncbi:hypothetical protein [Hymenobacter yonginensis]|uniref:Uncharacterized protein n=1 Tax=Hymenobacter yonginensis TaxID=748197 RepID=A0ABY7PTA3_9BACT|nr:hypothetical protein [Hymenobacter yonginensis]WBO86173.1 hypothetical protein O9Z63_07915 [Hymenobacter yonginensis]